MKLSNIILIISLIFLVVGCNAIPQEVNVVNKPIMFANEKNSLNGFCVMTSTSTLNDEKLYNDLKNEFLMLDKLFSKPIPCNNNNDCYEFLLDQDDYRSMAPEFEPYLNCEAKGITETNFKN